MEEIKSIRMETLKNRTREKSRFNKKNINKKELVTA
jgi:hypothetical protein